MGIPRVEKILRASMGAIFLREALGGFSTSGVAPPLFFKKGGFVAGQADHNPSYGALRSRLRRVFHLGSWPFCRLEQMPKDVASLTQRPSRPMHGPFCRCGCCSLHLGSGQGRNPKRRFFSQKTADFRADSPGNSGIWRAQETAENRRFSRRFSPHSPGNSSIWRAQETADFRRKPKILAENRSKTADWAPSP